MIGPAVELQVLAVIAQDARVVVQAQASQVKVVDAGMTVASAGAVDKRPEAAAVQARYQNAALLVFEELAVGLAHRSPFAGTDSEHQQARALAAKGLDDALAFRVAQCRTDQQQAALAQAALRQQGQASLHGQVGALAGLRHDRRVDGLEQVARGAQVV
ncbi:hypothetical protein D3C79_806760 [compost metagenome]